MRSIDSSSSAHSGHCRRKQETTIAASPGAKRGRFGPRFFQVGDLRRFISSNLSSDKRGSRSVCFKISSTAGSVSRFGLHQEKQLAPTGIDPRRGRAKRRP